MNGTIANVRSPAQIITIFNQKGGIGKTTTAVNLAVSLAIFGKRTLLIDLDSQGNATQSCGNAAPYRPGSYELLLGTAEVEKAARETSISNLFICSSSDELAGIDLELATMQRPQFKLADALERTHSFDYVVIDCPPALGMLPINALAAATSVIIPVVPEPLSHSGLHKAWKHIARVGSQLNPTLEIGGILLIMADGQQTRSHVEQSIHAEFGSRVLSVHIPRDEAVIDASDRCLPVLLTHPSSGAAQSYLSLAELVVARSGGPSVMAHSPHERTEAAKRLEVLRDGLIKHPLAHPLEFDGTVPGESWLGIEPAVDLPPPRGRQASHGAGWPGDIAGIGRGIGLTIAIAIASGIALYLWRL